MSESGTEDNEMVIDEEVDSTPDTGSESSEDEESKVSAHFAGFLPTEDHKEGIIKVLNQGFRGVNFNREMLAQYFIQNKTGMVLCQTKRSESDDEDSDLEESSEDEESTAESNFVYGLVSGFKLKDPIAEESGVLQAITSIFTQWAKTEKEKEDYVKKIKASYFVINERVQNLPPVLSQSLLSEHFRLMRLKNEQLCENYVMFCRVFRSSDGMAHLILEDNKLVSKGKTASIDVAIEPSEHGYISWYNEEKEELEDCLPYYRIVMVPKINFHNNLIEFFHSV